LRFELLEKLGELLFVLDFAGVAEGGVVERNADVIGFDDTREVHVHGLDDGHGCDVVFPVVVELLGAAAISFVNGLIHGAGAA
jgi:hypothetical protein